MDHQQKVALMNTPGLVVPEGVDSVEKLMEYADERYQALLKFTTEEARRKACTRKGSTYSNLMDALPRNAFLNYWKRSAIFYAGQILIVVATDTYTINPEGVLNHSLRQNYFVVQKVTAKRLKGIVIHYNGWKTLAEVRTNGKGELAEDLDFGRCNITYRGIVLPLDWDSYLEQVQLEVEEAKRQRAEIAEVSRLQEKAIFEKRLEQFRSEVDSLLPGFYERAKAGDYISLNVRLREILLTLRIGQDGL